MESYALKRIYKVGIVGAGVVSTMHLNGLQRHPELVAIHALCDSDEAKLNERADQYGIPNRYTSVEKFIRESGIDVVILCTPSHLRKEIIALFFEANIPIFCEKPLAESYEVAAEIAEMAAKYNVPIAIDQNFRRHFTFNMGKRILNEGTLGTPKHLSQVVNSMRKDVGWRLTRERYIMMVMSNHWFDGYRYMFSSEPTSIYCRAVPAPNSIKSDIAISAILEFDNGCVVSLSESFNSFTKMYETTLDCDNGGLIMGYSQLEIVTADGEKTVYDNPYDKAEATFYLLYDLLKSIEDNRKPETGIEDNLKTMRIVESAYMSLKQNKVINIRENF